MSACNGCRVLRKKCGGEKCILRQSLEGIGSSQQAQANATVFVAKFFGRVTFMSFLSSVPQNQRPALLESLVYEAVGRVVNPVSGAVGLLGAGRWNTCQLAVDTLLRHGSSSLLSIGPTSQASFLGRRRPKRVPKKREDHHSNVRESKSKALKLFI